MENSNQKLPNDLSSNESTEDFLKQGERELREREENGLRLNMDKEGLISLVIALLYLILGSLSGGGQGFFSILLFLMLPMSLIWFSDFLGGYMGSSWGFGGSVMRRIDAPTPAIFIKIAGWFFLFFPFIKIIFIAIFLKS